MNEEEFKEFQLGEAGFDTGSAYNQAGYRLYQSRQPSLGVSRSEVPHERRASFWEQLDETFPCVDEWFAKVPNWVYALFAVLGALVGLGLAAEKTATHGCP